MNTIDPNPTDSAPATPSRAATEVLIASSATDAAAVQAVEQHHAQLAGALTTHVETLLSAVGGIAGSGHDAVEQARRQLVDFCTSELLPHAAAEEESLYPAAAAMEPARLLVEAMVAEHRVLEGLVEQVRTTPGPVRAAAAGNALRVLFEVHLAKENDLILPLIAADPSVSLSNILAGMHQLLGLDDHAAHDDQTLESSGGCGGECGCGGDGEGAEASPVLDVRAVPHSIRHATVLGAVGAIPAGGSLLLVAPHDPLPLLDQIEAQEPGSFTVRYEESGPEAWRLQLTRSR